MQPLTPCDLTSQVPSPSTRTTVDAGSGPLSMWSTLRLNDMDKGSGSASARPGSAAAFGGIPEPEIPAGGAALVYAAMAGRGGHAPTGARGSNGEGPRRTYEI